MRKQSNDFVTKKIFDKEVKDLYQKIYTVKDGLIYYVDQRFKKIEETLEKHEKILESISKTLDWLVHKFTKLDDELTVAGSKYTEIHENLSNHETRIQVLEKKSSYVK